MAFVPSAAQLPPRRAPPVEDPRFLDLFIDGPAAADAILAGIPFDGAVIGRKGASGGPTAIREAMRFVSSYDPESTTDLAPFRLHDAGDIPVFNDQVLSTHMIVREHVRELFAYDRPVILLGGDNSLSTPHVQALLDAHRGRIGLVVVDAHYDMRAVPADGVPTSGTPYRRLIEDGTVQGTDVVEVGIRPFANARVLADVAQRHGVHVTTRAEVARIGAEGAASRALHQLKHCEHIFLSFDADVMDQAVACGVSAPGAGGLSFEEAASIVRTVAMDRRTKAMDLVEVAPNLDPTGNTARVAAQLVAAFVGGLANRERLR